MRKLLWILLTIAGLLAIFNCQATNIPPSPGPFGTPSSRVLGSYVPTPSGTGLPHVIGGAMQTSATLLVNGDVSGDAGVSLSKLEHCDAGSVLHGGTSANACAQVDLSSDVVSGSQWATIFDCDFSAQGSQTLTSNGNYTICGVTWTKSNSANDRVAMALTNGSGLIIQPTGASGNYATNRTAPMVFLPMSQVTAASTVTWYSGLRIWVYTTASTTVNNNSDILTVGIDNGSIVNNWFQRRYARTNATQNFLMADGVTVNSSSFFATFATVPAAINAAANGTTVLTIPQIFGAYGSTTMSAWGPGISAGNWPSTSILNPATQSNISVGNNAPSIVVDAGGSTFQSVFGLFIAAEGSGASDNVSFTVARVRIDTKFTN